MDPQFYVPLDCGTYSNPCKVGGIFVIVGGVSPGPPPDTTWTPCTSLQGGCFPEDPEPGDPPVVWGEEWNGSGSSFQDPGTLYPGSSAAAGMQRAEIQMAIREITKCPQLQSLLNEKLGEGRIRLWELDINVWGEQWGGDGTIYLTTRPNMIWDEEGFLLDHDELVDTLLHEVIHAWFGNPQTGHGNPDTQAHFQAAYDECK